jgi:hypothetical protein
MANLKFEKNKTNNRFRLCFHTISIFVKFSQPGNEAISSADNWMGQ